jgi:hypothetical protein
VIIPEAVVLHHSDGSYRGGVEWIASPASKVSYHVLIARDGRRTVFCQRHRTRLARRKEQLVRPARP